MEALKGIIKFSNNSSYEVGDIVQIKLIANKKDPTVMNLFIRNTG